MSDKFSKENIKNVLIGILEEDYIDTVDPKNEEEFKTKGIKDYGIDSLDLVEISIKLEREFDLNIPDSALEEFKTLQDIVDHISKAE